MIYGNVCWVSSANWPSKWYDTMTFTKTRLRVFDRVNVSQPWCWWHVESAWWLQMPWRLIGARASASTYWHRPSQNGEKNRTQNSYNADYHSKVSHIQDSQNWDFTVQSFRSLCKTVLHLWRGDRPRGCHRECAISRCRGNGECRSWLAVMPSRSCCILYVSFLWSMILFFCTNCMLALLTLEFVIKTLKCFWSIE